MGDDCEAIVNLRLVALKSQHGYDSVENTRGAIFVQLVDDYGAKSCGIGCAQVLE